MPERKLRDVNTSSKFCPICNHAERGEIELALLRISPNNPQLTLEVIADAYDLKVIDLQRHALMHTPDVLNFSPESTEAIVNEFKGKAGVTSPQPEPDGSASARLVDGATVVSNNGSRQRIADLVNMREGDLLLAAANEYYTTMVLLGKRIKNYAMDKEYDQGLPAFCTKAVVDLYIGCGSEIRSAVKGLNELNTALNGAHDPGADGLKALAEALSNSGKGNEQ